MPLKQTLRPPGFESFARRLNNVRKGCNLALWELLMTCIKDSAAVTKSELFTKVFIFKSEKVDKILLWDACG